MPGRTEHSATLFTDAATAARSRVSDVQAVLFDLDGTLIDTVELIRQSFRHATMTVLGFEVSDEVTMRNVGQPLTAQYREIAPEHAGELLAAHRGFTMSHHDALAREFPGTREVLEGIRGRGIPIGVVTSKGTEAATRGISAFGLTELLDVVLTADDVERHKPDPYPLQRAATLLSVELGYCIYVGDSPHDMQAAVDGGAIAVAALWGAFPAAEVIVPGTAFALASITELSALLDGRTGDLLATARESDVASDGANGGLW